MPIVQLQDGTKINFAKTPTPADVDFAYKQILAKKVQNTPPEDTRNVLQKGLGAFLDPIIENGVRLGQSVADIGLTGINKITGGALDKYTPEGNLNTALQRAENTPSQVPITGTNIKPVNEITNKDIAGNAIGTVALGVGSAPLGGAMIAGADALKNESTSGKVLGSLGVDTPESVGVAIDTVAGALGGKILEHGFNAVAPYIEKAVAKYGSPILEKIKQYVPESSKGFVDNLASKFPNIAEKKILPEPVSKLINKTESVASNIVGNPIKTFKEFSNTKKVINSLESSGNLTTVVNEAKAGNGGTLNLDGSSKELSNDYIVSVRSKNVPKDSLTEKDITDFISENKDIISKFGNDVKIGTFDLGDGNVSIDINLALKDKNKALELAKSGQQQSVFDETTVKSNPKAFEDGSAFMQTGFDGSTPKSLSVKEIQDTIGTSKDLQSAIDATSPVLNKKETISSFEKAGMTGGINSKGKSGTYTYTPTEYDKKVGEAVSGIVSAKKAPIDNLININKNIQKISEDEIKPFLAKEKVPFNFEDLRRNLELVSPDSSLKADPSALSTYSRVREELLNDIYNFIKKNSDTANLTDFNVIWDSAKMIDKKIEQELGNTVFGTPQYTGVRASAKDMRDAFRQFISDSLGHPGQMEQLNRVNDFIKESAIRGNPIPKENIPALKEQFGIKQTPEDVARAEFIDNKINKLNLMYEARARVAEANFRLYGKNFIQRWIKQNPAKYKTAKTLLGGLIGYSALNLVN